MANVEDIERGLGVNSEIAYQFQKEYKEPIESSNNTASIIEKADIFEDPAVHN